MISGVMERGSVDLETHWEGCWVKGRCECLGAEIKERSLLVDAPSVRRTYISQSRAIEVVRVKLLVACVPLIEQVEMSLARAQKIWLT